MKNLKTILLVILLGGAFNITAQQSINASGGESTGSGYASYSIGQITYTSIDDIGGANLIQGVQIPFEFLTPISSLSGNLSGLVGCSEREMTIGIYNSDQTLNKFLEVSIDSNGDYNAVGTPTGTFDIYVTVQGYLTKSYPDFLLNSGVNELDVLGIIAGDLNESNSVNIQDISILSFAFGTDEGSANYNFLADFNCDGFINILDISIMSISFGLQGDTTP